MFASSLNGGHTFGTSKNISNNGGISIAPQIVANGNNVYIVWNDAGQPRSFDIFFAASTDGGQNFILRKNISLNENNSIDPRIIVLGNHIYVAWIDNTPGNLEVLFTVSY